MISQEDKKASPFFNNCQTVKIIHNTCNRQKLYVDLEQYFLKNGYKIVEDIKEADAIIANTCAVTQSTEDKIVKQLLEVTKIKKKNASIVVMGCLPNISKSTPLDGEKDIILFKRCSQPR
jgi:tRNA A37 methylthiotransferase MiaB